MIEKWKQITIETARTIVPMAIIWLPLYVAAQFISAQVEIGIDRFLWLFLAILLPLFLLVITFALSVFIQGKSPDGRDASNENLIIVRPILEFLAISTIFPLSVGIVVVFFIRQEIVDENSLAIVAMILTFASFLTSLFLASSYWGLGRIEDVTNEEVRHKLLSLPKSQFLSIASLWTYRGAVCFLFVPYWLVLTQMSDFRIIWIEAQTMQILNFLMHWGVAFLLVLLGIFCWWMPARLQDVRPRAVWNRDERIPALSFWRLMRDAQPEAERQKSRGMIKIGLSMVGVGVLLLLILWLIPK